jgi:hypothetical protein
MLGRGQRSLSRSRKRAILLGVQQTGAFKFYVNLEALPQKPGVRSQRGVSVSSVSLCLGVICRFARMINRDMKPSQFVRGSDA